MHVVLARRVVPVPGPTLDALSANTGSTLGQIGIVFTANGLGFVAGAMLAGRLFERADGRRILAISTLALGLATALVPGVESLSALLVLFVAIGVAIGLIDVGSNTTLVWEFGERVPPYMNALHLSWGVGAFIAPLLVALLVASGAGATATYWLLAAMMAPAALGLLLTPATSIPATADSAASPAVRLSARSMIWLDLAGAGLAVAVVVLFAEWQPAIWTGVALFGISIASIFASCINYAGTRMPITSKVTSAFLVGASIGSMSLPWLTGVLFASIGPPALPYVVGTTIALALVVFATITRLRAHA